MTTHNQRPINTHISIWNWFKNEWHANSSESEINEYYLPFWIVASIVAEYNASGQLIGAGEAFFNILHHALGRLNDHQIVHRIVASLHTTT